MHIGHSGLSESNFTICPEGNIFVLTKLIIT